MNAGKYKCIIGAVTITAMIALPAIAGAATPISNLRVSQAGDFVELEVVGGGNTLCDQSTAPAINGRPFRIVLDFCDADHALGELNFNALPKTRISSIRTSQYSVSPKRIVRVVLDMTEEVTYSVNSEGSHLVVRIVDPNPTPFTAWEANPSGTEPSPDQQSTSLAVDAEPVSETAEATPTESQESEEVIASVPAPDPAPVEPAPVQDDKPVTDDGPAVATVEEPVSLTETVTAPANQFQPPPVPLVYAPDKDIDEAPDAGQATDRTISKESMDPLGPNVPTATEIAAAEERANKSLWASTTPSTSPTPATSPQGDQDEAAAAEDDTPQTLLERLKTKFFGNQVPPRPYTTVEDEDFSAGEVYGPPAPSSDLDRDALLKRIQRTKQRVAEGEYGPEQGGAGGVPTRAVLYYDDRGRRDPFQPLVTGLRSGFMTDQLPDIETLRLVGVLHDDHEPLALLENVEGFSYVMRVGDKVSTGSLVSIQGKRALFRIEEYGWSHVIALQLTPRGTDPSKTLGMGPREYPEHDDENGETDSQGSSEE
jgi:hypothetical protein